jgi:hypothetical protein
MKFWKLNRSVGAIGILCHDDLCGVSQVLFIHAPYQIMRHPRSSTDVAQTASPHHDADQLQCVRYVPYQAVTRPCRLPNGVTVLGTHHLRAKVARPLF